VFDLSGVRSRELCKYIDRAQEEWHPSSAIFLG
jgi:hypothetical protein